MKATRTTQTSTGEYVIRGEFDQIARSLTTRIANQRAQVEQRAAAHRSTRHQKRKLAALAHALSRIEALKSRLC